jgi:hypothetical protein
MFECLACTLLQISPLKLCFEKLRYFLNVFSECRKCYFIDPNFKNFRGGLPPDPLANSCLRYSAHTFSDRILCWGRARKKNALDLPLSCQFILTYVLGTRTHVASNHTCIGILACIFSPTCKQLPIYCDAGY